MAFLSKKELIEKCGVSYAYLSVAIARENVILTGEFIDDTKPENADWIKKRLDAKQKKEVAGPKVEENTGKSTVTEEEVKKTEQFKGGDTNSSSSSRANYTSKYDLETDIKVLEAEKKREEIELLRIKREKLEGQVIPTDLCEMLFKQHTKSIMTSLEQGIMLHLKNLTTKKEFSRTEQAEVRIELRKILTDSISKAVEDTSSQLENIISEYQQKKEVGEKE